MTQLQPVLQVDGSWVRLGGCAGSLHKGLFEFRYNCYDCYSEQS